MTSEFTTYLSTNIKRQLLEAKYRHWQDTAGPKITNTKDDNQTEQNDSENQKAQSENVTNQLQKPSK